MASIVEIANLGCVSMTKRWSRHALRLLWRARSERATHEPPVVNLPLSVTVVAHDVGSVGGMERQLFELIVGLLERGVHITLISRTCGLPSHSHLRWVRVPCPARPFAIAYPWFFVFGSLLVSRHRRGILHTTGAIVWNSADLATVHYCHHGGGLALSRARQRTVLYRLNARAAASMSRAAERLIYRGARLRALVCVAESVASQIRRYLPVAPVPIVIANGVDAEAFVPDTRTRAEMRSELRLGDGELVALFVGGDWTRKGLETAIEAVSEAPGWSLVVVGPGDATRYHGVLDGRLRFVGATAAPARYYAAADAFVLPSLQEGDPLVVYEAAAAGLPVLAADVGDIRRVVVDGESGWILPRDSKRIAEKLVLLRDPRLRVRLGREGRRFAEACDWSVVCERYLTLYRRLGEESNPERLVVREEAAQ